MWCNDCGVLASAPCGQHPQEELGAYPGVGHRWRGGGYLCGVLPPSAEFSGLSGGGVTSKVSHAGQAMGKFYVKALEAPSVHPTGGAIPLAMVPKLNIVDACDKVDMQPNCVQVKSGNGDETEEAGRGDIL